MPGIILMRVVLMSLQALEAVGLIIGVTHWIETGVWSHQTGLI